MTADESTTGGAETPADEPTGQQRDEDTWETSEGKGGKKTVLAELNQARRELKAANRDLEQLRAASMTEQEKAVAAAKAEGQTQAARDSAPRLVRAELRATAAEAGLSQDALAGFLEYADLSKFVGDDGQPDDKAIKAAVKRLGGGKSTDFDGGARTTAAAPADMNSLIRRGAGLS